MPVCARFQVAALPCYMDSRKPRIVMLRMGYHLQAGTVSAQPCDGPGRRRNPPLRRHNSPATSERPGVGPIGSGARTPFT